MKVLRLLPELDFGGVESRVEVQARLYDRSVYQLRVCAFHKPGRAAQALTALGIPVDVLGVNPSPRNPRAPVALARYLRRLRPDIVHASIAEANFHSLLAAVPGGGAVAIAEETGMPSHSLVARLAYRGVYQLADTVVGVTKAVCDYARDVDGAPADRVKLIYNCAGPDYFPTSPAEPGGAADGPLTILLVGRLVPVKNHLFFLRVLEQALPKDGSVRVLFAGEGPLRAEMEAALRQRGLDDRVSLLGLRSDVRQLLSQAHVFALPSASEGCSISLIEAMATGIHAIGSDVPGIREVMGSLADDWTAPPGSLPAWTALLERAIRLSREQRAHVSRSGQRRVYEIFSPSSYVANLQALYLGHAQRRQGSRVLNALRGLVAGRLP